MKNQPPKTTVVRNASKTSRTATSRSRAGLIRRQGWPTQRITKGANITAPLKSPSHQVTQIAG